MIELKKLTVENPAELKIFKNFGNLLIKKVMLITLYILSIFMLGLLYLKIMQMNLIMKETN